VSLDLARAVADAVLYEGYLLYPYRASSGKNRVRWQFGVLGPPGAAETGVGEEPSMAMQCVLTNPSVEAVVHLRFLQLQRRQVYDGQGRPVEQLTAGGTTLTSWDEAVEQEVTLPFSLSQLIEGGTVPVDVPGGEDVEPVTGDGGAAAGSVRRQRWPLSAELEASVVHLGGYTRLDLRVSNVAALPGNEPLDKDSAIRHSLIGAHLLVEAPDAGFVSLLDPPEAAADAVAQCAQHRCWPVLAGAPGETGLVLGSPIIVYDYPEIAEQSAGALYDATEIDEILTLRVMTMTDEEKAEARATDPRAREIIDRCDQMSPETLARLHGVLRNPHAEEVPVFREPGPDIRNAAPPDFGGGEVPWWDPAADAAVRPETDAVVVDGVSVSKGSLVRVRPRRRADAQDLFFAGKVAEVTAVLSDVDGAVHVALVLVDDPAADLHDWYGRYLYFAPDEVEPLSEAEAGAAKARIASEALGTSAQHPAVQNPSQREESRP
jgi:hypothetical protein